MTKTKIMALMFGVLLVGACARPAKAGVVVGTCVAGTQYLTIQSAVNAAASGSTIMVCPNAYPEQVIIQKPLTLEGITKNGLAGILIVPPASGLLPTTNDTNTTAQITIQNTSGVTLNNLIVDAAGNTLTCASPPVTGIVFDSASGTVNNVAVRNQVAGGAGGAGCDGFGLFAFNATSQPQTVTVENSDFRNIATWGISGEGQVMKLNTLNNYVAGPDNSQHATIGIFYFGVTGTIQGNTVVNEILPAGTAATPLSNSIGIGLACTTANVTGNRISDTQLGIFIGGCEGGAFPSNSTITQNQIFETKLFDGIYISMATGNTISNNTIVGSGEAGIHFDTGANSNTASGNMITEACTGVLSAPKVSNKLSANTFKALYQPTLTGTRCGPIF
jgi:parallel beta-helix repeat protein